MPAKYDSLDIIINALVKDNNNIIVAEYIPTQQINGDTSNIKVFNFR